MSTLTYWAQNEFRFIEKGQKILAGCGSHAGQGHRRAAREEIEVCVVHNCCYRTLLLLLVARELQKMDLHNIILRLILIISMSWDIFCPKQPLFMERGQKRSP